MKRTLIFSLFALVAFSCDFNDQPEPKDEGQTWNLVGYQEMVDGNLEYTPVSDSTFSYSLRTDGTFIKKVGNYTVDGTYKTTSADNLTHYIFQFNSKNSLLIHSCDEGMEDYFINSQGELAGTWDSCDGTKLFLDRQ